MAVTDKTKTPARAAAKRPRLVAEAIPAFGVADGVQSWRHGLRARERATVDRALAILGARLRSAGEVFDSPGAVRAYLSLHLAADPCERFAVLYLDGQNRAIAYECHFAGTLTQTSAYPREIAVAAMKHQAAAVILAHNHPSGEVMPSKADHSLTRALQDTLALIDVRVLDHIIVGGVQSFSMAEEGLI
jgi:DNA repair protein RadC